MCYNNPTLKENNMVKNKVDALMDVSMVVVVLSSGAKEYTVKTRITGLEVDDLVMIDLDTSLRMAKVVDLNPQVNALNWLEQATVPTMPTLDHVGWLFQVVDTEHLKALKETEVAITTQLESQYNATTRKSVIEQAIAMHGEDTISDIQALVSKL